MNPISDIAQFFLIATAGVYLIARRLYGKEMGAMFGLSYLVFIFTVLTGTILVLFCWVVIRIWIRGQGWG